jgi:DUF1365 family protein
VTARVEHIAGQTYHGRKGAVSNDFRYSIDYLLVDAEAEADEPPFFRRNAPGLMSLRDRDHGGTPGQGRGAAWVREVLAAHDVEGIARIELLAQPRVFGHVFNPVSFWLCRDAQDRLIAVIPEVSNTYGDRHSYICFHEDRRPIAPDDHLQAAKVFHFSPFQPIGGGYTFRFDIGTERIGIWIDYTSETGGLIATLTGRRAPLTVFGMVKAMLRRPFGARRVLALIHWQALKLWWKGARFRNRPAPPTEEVTR